ncbi:Uncharacterised protein [uncultured archaeon]|nr:Uncharacterised protein [uncultured archaeon]
MILFLSYKNEETNQDAQITIDYVAGMGVFLLTVAFVFQFMYSLFLPFQSGSDEVTLAADRVSTVLVERVLTADKSGQVNTIDQGKLDYFTKTRLKSYDLTAYNDALREVGLFSSENVFDFNVSAANLSNPDKPMYQGGPSPPENLDIGQTKRLVMIVNSSTGYNETAIISVKVW